MRMPLRELIVRLRPDGGLRCRTGLLLVPPDELDELPQWGARFGLDTIAYGERLLEELPAESRFVHITAESESERLRRIADAVNGTPVLLIAQLDLAIARLGTEERRTLWQNLLARLTQTRHGLLLAMPQNAHRLLPEETVLENLRETGRIAELEE